MLNPDAYYGLDKARLVIRFVEVVTSLGELYIQRHTAEVELTKERFRSYDAHIDAPSEAAKHRLADQETFYLQEALDDLKTQILVHQEERDMLKVLLENHRGQPK